MYRFRCIWCFVLVILSRSVLAQPQMNNTERANFQKNHLLSTSAYALKLNRGIDKHTFLEQRTSYDIQGNISSITQYDSTDLEMLKWTCAYNANNQLISRSFCIYRDTIAKTTVTYTEKGFPSEETTENADGVTLLKFVYVCDAKGKIRKATEDIFPESKEYVRQAYRFDQQGFLLLRFLGEAKGRARINYSYDYTKTGLLSRMTEIGQDTIPFGWVEFEYTKDGALRSFSVKHENGKRYRIFTNYDSHGGLKEQFKSLYLNTVLLDQEKDEYTVDSKGLVKKRLRYKFNNELFMLYNFTHEFYE